MLWCLFVIGFFTILFLCNRDKISGLRTDWRAWVGSKKQCKWTTYFHKGTYIDDVHFVPIEARHHITDPDGKCWCHTNKETHDFRTVVYRHERLGFRMPSMQRYH